MIGLMGAAFFGTMTLISATITRVIRSEIGGLRGEMRAAIGGLRAEMTARFETVDARFAAVNVAIDNLDRGVRALTQREINRGN